MLNFSPTFRSVEYFCFQFLKITSQKLQVSDFFKKMNEKATQVFFFECDSARTLIKTETET